MAQMTEALARWMYMSETVLMQHLGGYRFNGNVHEILIEATSDIAAALRALPVSFSQAARDREIQQIRSKTAQCDKGLQSLLLTVQSESIAEEQS